MSIRLILVLISFFFLQNTPSVSASGYVRFANFSPDEVFFAINSVTLPSTKSGDFTGFFSFAPGTQNITVVNTFFTKTFTGTFTVTDLVSKFVAVVSDGASSYVLDDSPEVTVTSAPVGVASVIIGNYAPASLAASVDGTVHAFYTPTDYTEEIFVNTTDPNSFTNTTTRNISIQLVIGGTSNTSFTLQIQAEAKYLVLAGLAANGSVQHTVVQYAGNKVLFSYLCNQVWTATNPDPYPITFKWDWRPRKKRFSLTLGALSSNLVVVETKQNANSKKIYTYQYDSDHLTQKFVQTIFDKKCLSVSSLCRGKYKLTNLATRALPVVYESFSPSGLNDGLYTTITNSTFVTLPLTSTTTVNTTAVSAPYFKTGYQEVFKVWLAVNGAKSRLLSTYQGAVSQGSKCK